MELLSLARIRALILILRWRAGSGGRRWWRGRIHRLHIRIDMAVHGRERGGEKDCADDDENHGVGVAEFKEAAAHLLEEKEYADRDDDGRADEGANRASRATASWVIAHR